MANFIELSNAEGPRAINIEHIRSFAPSGQGTRLTFNGDGGQEDVKESYDVVRVMLNVTSAPKPSDVVTAEASNGLLAQV